MTFFEFEAREIIDEDYHVTLSIEPVGSSYKYTLKFEDQQNNAQFEGRTKSPLLALVKLRNLLTATVDTLLDCIELTKSAASQIEIQDIFGDADRNTMFGETDEDNGYNDENDNEGDENDGKL